jgi:tetratricopeptide (TPR) repeat protein
VRITGQLIDTTGGAHIWADRFDGALDDIFELQDQVASNVVGAIEPRLRLSEIEKAARKRCDRRLQSILLTHPPERCSGFVVPFSEDGGKALSEAEITEALYLARQALEIGKDDPDALWMAADTVSILAHEHATAAGAIDRALRLNPNSAHGWMARDWVACCQNQPRPAIEALKRAVRLSPLDPLGYFFSGGLALAHLSAGEYEEALDWADPCFREYPRYLIALLIKLVCCAHLGRTEQAQSAMGQLLDLARGQRSLGSDQTQLATIHRQL